MEEKIDELWNHLISVSNEDCLKHVTRSTTVSLVSFDVHKHKVPNKVRYLTLRLSYIYKEYGTLGSGIVETSLDQTSTGWAWRNKQKPLLSFQSEGGDKVEIEFQFFWKKPTSCMGSKASTSKLLGIYSFVFSEEKAGTSQAVSEDIRSFCLKLPELGVNSCLNINFKLQAHDERDGRLAFWLTNDLAESYSIYIQDPLDFVHRDMHELLSVTAQASVDCREYQIWKQSIVNYMLTPVFEWWEIRSPQSSGNIFPEAVQICLADSGAPVAVLIPVRINITKTDKGHPGSWKSVLVVTSKKKYCLCSGDWRSKNEFEVIIHYFKTGDIERRIVRWRDDEYVHLSDVRYNHNAGKLKFSWNPVNILESLCLALSLRLLRFWTPKLMEELPSPSCSKQGRPRRRSSHKPASTIIVDEDAPSFDAEHVDMAMLSDCSEDSSTANSQQASTVDM